MSRNEKECLRRFRLRRELPELERTARGANTLHPVVQTVPARTTAPVLKGAIYARDIGTDLAG